MKRGDIVRVSLPGDYGKPRPALVIQSDLFSEHPSVTVLPVTSELRDTPLFRIRLSPDSENALNRQSDVMIDKTMTIARSRIGAPFGRVRADAMLEIDRRLALFLGIAK